MEEPQTSTVYLGNLDQRVTRRVLYELGIQGGPVASVHLPMEGEKHKGFGFVEYDDHESAAYAISLFRGTLRLFDRAVRVEWGGQTRRSSTGAPGRLPSGGAARSTPQGSSRDSQQQQVQGQRGQQQQQVQTTTAAQQQQQHAFAPILILPQQQALPAQPLLLVPQPAIPAAAPAAAAAAAAAAAFPGHGANVPPWAPPLPPGFGSEAQAAQPPQQPMSPLQSCFVQAQQSDY